MSVVIEKCWYAKTPPRQGRGHQKREISGASRLRNLAWILRRLPRYHARDQSRRERATDFHQDYRFARGSSRKSHLHIRNPFVVFVPSQLEQ